MVLGLVMVGGGAARAEDARVAFLTRQLKGTSDARVKAQTVLLLGQTGAEGAVGPLCEALKDPEAVVRSAAANALGDLRLASALDCLKAGLGESDQAVRTAMERALAVGPVSAGALYVNIEPIEDKVGSLPPTALPLAEKIMREKLSGFGAAFAPPNEEKKSAAALIKARNLKGYALKLQLLPGASANGMKVEMLIMTYPEQALKGSWNVKGSGAKPESLIKVMVPRVLEDAAGDLEWKH